MNAVWRQFAGRNALFITVLLSAFVGYMGCGESKVGVGLEDGDDAGGEGDVGGEVGPAPGVQSFSTATSSAMCEKLFECCSEAELEAELGSEVSSSEECTEQATAISLIFGYGQINNAVERGTVEVDEDLIEMCEDSIANASCDEISSQTSVDGFLGCREVFTPTLSQGEECEINDECKTGFCSLESGACQEVPAEGEECPEFRCEEGAYCSTLTDRCEPKEPAGGPCPDDFACVSDNCQSGENGSLTCQASEPLCTGG